MKKTKILVLALTICFCATIFAVCGGGGGGEGTTSSAPAAPSGVKASPGVRQTSITWNSAAGASSYNLYWSTSSGVTTGSSKISGVSSNYVHNSLTAGTKYYYSVSSSNSVGESGLSGEVSAIPHVTVPEAIADHIINIPYELPTIQAGLDTAVTGDEVRVHDGTYYENLIWPAVDGIKLKSVNGRDYTIIDGGMLAGVITINRVDSSYNITTATLIEGFTITNGNFDEEIHPEQSDYYDGGGGIYLWRSSPMINNNIITGNNSEYHGGGIAASWEAYPLITNNYITNNTANMCGGGIYCRNDSDSTINNNTVRNNSAFHCGGGIYASPTSQLTVNIANTVENNYDYDCVSTPDCANNCIISAGGITFGTGGNTGGGTGSSGNSACDACLAGCSGLSSCCQGYGCICADECTSACVPGTHLYCTMWGDCFCVTD